MKKHHIPRQNSGQVLVITSLIVAILLLSTAAYVIEIEENAPVYEADFDSTLSNYKLAAMHTVISALANMTNGGSPDVLATDLTELDSVFSDNSYRSMINTEFEPVNDGFYENGAYISWGSNGIGISSACVNFALNSSSPSSSYYSEFTVNVTSEININGSYASLNETQEQVNVTCTVLNEGEPALAQNFTIFCELGASNQGWLQVASPTTTDYGNGSYLISFIFGTANQSGPTLVSVSCSDLRGIIIEANSTCTQA